MYIAFKWLTGLTVVMWMGMCCIDMCLKKNYDSGTGLIFEIPCKNLTTTELPRLQDIPNIKNRNSYLQQNIAVLHGVMFVAGALAVLIFNKKSEIILYTKSKISKIKIRAVVTNIKQLIKKNVLSNGIIAGKMLWEHVITVRNLSRKFANHLNRKRDDNQRKINTILLKKMEEIGDERQNNGQLLISAIRENKSIRMQYQLESMAKNRLLRHMDDMQKKIKENRSRYVSFQHLYLVTHQENIFLKARVRKLLTEKEKAENNLLRLINEVYKFKNSELKAYCSRLIVQTKDNLLSSDVRAEIQTFLNKCRMPKDQKNSSWQISEERSLRINSRSRTRCSPFITEVNDDTLMPLVCDAPKLKGLPGEYVWTVKDKDDIIGKLHEYDYDPELDNGDIIRRIRQYSVYSDKDCLLDYITSKMIIFETSAVNATICSSLTATALSPIADRGLVTGSEAFQKFLRKNDNIIHPSIAETPLVCG